MHLLSNTPVSFIAIMLGHGIIENTLLCPANKVVALREAAVCPPDCLSVATREPLLTNSKTARFRGMIIVDHFPSHYLPSRTVVLAIVFTV